MRNDALTVRYLINERKKKLSCNLFVLHWIILSTLSKSTTTSKSLELMSYNACCQIIMTFYSKADIIISALLLVTHPIQQKCHFSFCFVADEHQNQKMRSKRLGYLKVIMIFDVRIPSERWHFSKNT